VFLFVVILFVLATGQQVTVVIVVSRPSPIPLLVYSSVNICVNSFSCSSYPDPQGLARRSYTVELLQREGVGAELYS